MADVHLTLSCGDYDRTRALIDHTISAPGLDLTVTPVSSSARHARFVKNLEFDVCELQVALYLGLKARGHRLRRFPFSPIVDSTTAVSWFAWTPILSVRKIFVAGGLAYMVISIPSHCGSEVCCSTSLASRQGRYSGSPTVMILFPVGRRPHG